METPPESALEAFRTSAYSYQALARHLAPLMERGGSVVGLDFDASVAWPSYDWMGVAKAALESVNRYLARELGPRGIRVNLISAGPISSPAASGIHGFERPRRGLAGGRAARLGHGRPDTGGARRLFLLSDWSEAISGEVIHVDGGAHAVAGRGVEQRTGSNGGAEPLSSTPLGLVRYSLNPAAASASAGVRKPSAGHLLVLKV